MRADQSAGPSRLSSCAVRRKEAEGASLASVVSIVTRTRVFGARATGSSGRSTSPSKVAKRVLVIGYLSAKGYTGR
jgi:hypothetical protein